MQCFFCLQLNGTEIEYEFEEITLERVSTGPRHCKHSPLLTDNNARVRCVQAHLFIKPNAIHKQGVILIGWFTRRVGVTDVIPPSSWWREVSLSRPDVQKDRF